MESVQVLVGVLVGVAEAVAVPDREEPADGVRERVGV
jgi:hypothetical protein